MARTVRNIQAHGEQRFFITVHGLNVNTLLNLYFNNRKIPASQLQPANGSAGDPISTDDNGSAQFFYFFTNGTDTTERSEADYINFLQSRAGSRTVIVIDKASVDDDSLPSNYTSRARCYAETVIIKEFEVKFTEIQDWGTSSRTGESYTRFY